MAGGTAIVFICSLIFTTVSLVPGTVFDVLNNMYFFELRNSDKPQSKVMNVVQSSLSFFCPGIGPTLCGRAASSVSSLRTFFVDALTWSAHD